ncbi:MAG: hypothetical protein BWY76_03202 [bacterium ADurb.Bin429]|nr:MAG: hypothetical protein BWY76_03202 [bacterium ADurb.Bin429]
MLGQPTPPDAEKTRKTTARRFEIVSNVDGENYARDYD